MNDETKVVRAKMAEALDALAQTSATKDEAVEQTISEVGVLLETFLPKWKGLTASSLAQEDSAALARTAVDLLQGYERLIERAEARLGPLDDVPRSVFDWRDYWSNLVG